MEYMTYELCSATVSISEQLPEDGQMGPKPVSIDVSLLSF
jgi:hypothetical protein